MNECMEENDCDDEAECSNTIHDYACTCTTKGFKGSGKECIGKLSYCISNYF